MLLVTVTYSHISYAEGVACETRWQTDVKLGVRGRRHQLLITRFTIGLNSQCSLVSNQWLIILQEPLHKIVLLCYEFYVFENYAHMLKIMHNVCLSSALYLTNRKTLHVHVHTYHCSHLNGMSSLDNSWDVLAPSTGASDCRWHTRSSLCCLQVCSNITGLG